MSRLHAAGVIIVIVLASLSILAGCTGQQYAPATEIQTKATPAAAQSSFIMPDSGLITQSFSAMPQSNVTNDEALDIIYVQESEKVQRDFYAYAASKNPSVLVFSDMGMSAGLLMSADDLILKRYNIPSPTDETPGIFVNKNLQTLYNLLTSQSAGTIPDSLSTAATSEEVHISDLSSALDRTDNADLKYMYNQQLAASRNDLRVIDQQITALGQTYKPQYITAEAYSAIVASKFEQIPFATVTPAPTSDGGSSHAAEVVVTRPPAIQTTVIPTTVTPVSTQTLSAKIVKMAQPDATRITASFDALPNGTLSQMEMLDIAYLEESEKLQGDLFSLFAAQYPNAPVFSDMARSSSTMTNADDVILTRYNLTDPELLTPGEFNNAKLQTQFTLLSGQGAAGLADALSAAASSEDLHIADLGKAIGRTDNQDLKYMFSQELAAAKNNLRLINAQLVPLGKPFTPVYLSKDAYNAIVYSDPEPVATMA